MSKAVEGHYARERGLLKRIRQALADAGIDESKLTTSDLAPLDQFHVRGHEATRDLAKALDLKPGMRVLDIGSGIGGPARLLAELTGAEVTGVDLTRDYVEAAKWLSEATGLAGKADFQQADALDLPFADASFDAVYTQHVAMNIEDKPALYREAHRVLKPGGRFFLYDMMAGPKPGGPHFPVPWALDETTSFLARPEEVRGYLKDAGFELQSERDLSKAALEWFGKWRSKTQAEGAPKLGLHLLLGPIFAETGRNQLKNFEDRRVVLWEMVARKP